MTTEQILAFITVSKYLNFTKASEILFVSQPNLSRMITSLESELNLQLFIRGNKSIRMTPAGQVLSQQFQITYDQLQEGIKEAKAIQYGHNGKVVVGILEGTDVSDFLPNMLGYFKKYHPNVLIEPYLYSFHDLLNGLYNNTLDIVFTLEFNLEERPGIRYEKLEDTKDNIAIPANSPLYRKEKIELSDFDGQDMIVISSEDLAMITDKVTARFRELKIAPVYHYAPSLGTAMLWLENGIGSAFLFSRNRLSNKEHIRFVEVKSPWPTAFVMGWTKDNHNPCLPGIIEFCRNFFPLSS